MIKYAEIPPGGEMFIPCDYEMQKRNVLSNVQYYRKAHGLPLKAKDTDEGVWIFRGNE